MKELRLAGIFLKDFSASRWCDVAIVSGLIVFASLSFYTTPEFAANLPEDGTDAALPAVNLLERGKLTITAYGHDFPPGHPFGLPLLLAPVYAVTGHFPGNGVYAILLCALGATLVTYWLGVKLRSRVCGSLAALFLITHYGFWQYSQKVMSEVPSIFLVTTAFALALLVPPEASSRLRCIAIGVVLGFAITVRYDNLLFLAPVAALLSWDGPWSKRLQRVGACIVGLAPWIAVLAFYHQANFGRVWRTGYRYWHFGDAPAQPMFSTRYITTPGFLRTKQLPERLAGLVEGNGSLYAKSLLAESDTTRIFGDPLYWQLPGRRLYQMLALLRTGLGMIGLLMCVSAIRQSRVKQRFLVWLGISVAVSLGLYLLYCAQDERFLMRLVPSFCLASGIGAMHLLTRMTACAARIIGGVILGALVAAFALFDWQMGFPTGNDLHAYETLTQAASQMESNAVVVTNFNPFRIDLYVIRDTKRLAVPLVRDRGGIEVFVGNDTTRTAFHPFVASENPERLRELIHSGRPAYWLINDPWSGLFPSDLETLRRSFRLQVLATVSVNRGAEQPYFGRIYDLPQNLTNVVPLS